MAFLLNIMPYTVDELIEELNQCGRFDYAKVVELVAALNAGGGGGGGGFGYYLINGKAAAIQYAYYGADDVQIGATQSVGHNVFKKIAEADFPAGATYFLITLGDNPEAFAYLYNPTGFSIPIRYSAGTESIQITKMMIAGATEQLIINSVFDNLNTSIQSVFNATAETFILKIFENDYSDVLLTSYYINSNQEAKVNVALYGGKYMRFDSENADLYFMTDPKTGSPPGDVYLDVEHLTPSNASYFKQIPVQSDNFNSYVLIHTPVSIPRYTIVNAKNDGTAVTLGFFDVDGSEGVQIGDDIIINWLERYDFVPADFPEGATIVKIKGTNDLAKLGLFPGSVLNSSGEVILATDDYAIVLDIISASIGFTQSHFITVLNVPTPGPPSIETIFNGTGADIEIKFYETDGVTLLGSHTVTQNTGHEIDFSLYGDKIVKVEGVLGLDFWRMISQSSTEDSSNPVSLFFQTNADYPDYSDYIYNASAGANKTTLILRTPPEDTITINNKTSADTIITWYDFSNPSDYTTQTVLANTTLTVKRPYFPFGYTSFKVGAPLTDFYYTYLDYQADGANNTALEKVTGVDLNFGFYLYTNTNNIKQLVIELFEAPEVVKAGVFFQNETNAPLTIDFKNGSGGTVESHTLTAKDDTGSYPNQMLKIFYKDLTPGVAYFTAPAGIGINITTHVLINNNGYANYYPGTGAAQDFGGVDPDIFYYFALLPA